MSEPLTSQARAKLVQEINRLPVLTYPDDLVLRYEATVQALEVENARLRAALAPLAGLLTAINEDWPDDRPIYIRNDALLTVGDLRSAHALLAAPADDILLDDTPEQLARRRQWARDSIGW